MLGIYAKTPRKQLLNVLLKGQFIRFNIDLPSTRAGLTGSIRETISARSVKEAFGQVTNCKNNKKTEVRNCCNTHYNSIVSLSGDPGSHCCSGICVTPLEVCPSSSSPPRHSCTIHQTRSSHAGSPLPICAHKHEANQKQYKCRTTTEHLECRR